MIIIELTSSKLLRKQKYSKHVAIRGKVDSVKKIAIRNKFVHTELKDICLCSSVDVSDYIFCTYTIHPPTYLPLSVYPIKFSRIRIITSAENVPQYLDTFDIWIDELLACVRYGLYTKDTSSNFNRIVYIFSFLAKFCMRKYAGGKWVTTGDCGVGIQVI